MDNNIVDLEDVRRKKATEDKHDLLAALMYGAVNNKYAKPDPDAPEGQIELFSLTAATKRHWPICSSSTNSLPPTSKHNSLIRSDQVSGLPTLVRTWPRRACVSASAAGEAIFPRGKIMTKLSMAQKNKIICAAQRLRN